MSRRYLSQEPSELGVIASLLQQLRGYDTLLSELVQNADDAKTAGGEAASSVKIDVTDEALIVINDGVFSTCSLIDADECQLLADRGERCDLHGFRTLAESNKAGDITRTGAMGIGFTAVYQICDAPEIYTGPYHFTVRPDEPAAKRIEFEDDIAPARTTEVRLAWALDSSTRMRRALNNCRVENGDQQRLFEAFREVLPLQGLFLRHISSFTLSRNGVVALEVETEREADRIIVRSGSEGRHYLRTAKQARPNAQYFLPERRSQLVETAIPLSGSEDQGLIFCTLPTRQTTGSYFHVNGDFVPTMDRKSIVLEENGVDARWNQFLLGAAAETAADGMLGSLAELDQPSFWRMVKAVYDGAQDRRPGGRGIAGDLLTPLWLKLATALPQTACIECTDGVRRKPSTVWAVTQAAAEWLPTLTAIAIPCARPELRQYQNVLATLGVRDIRLSTVAGALNRTAPTSGTPVATCAAPFDNLDLGARADEILSALDANEKSVTDKRAASQLLATSAILVVDDRWRKPNECRFADPEAIELFGPVVRACAELVRRPLNVAGYIAALVPSFDPKVALECLSAVRDGFHGMICSDPSLGDRILTWLAKANDTGAFSPDDLGTIGSFEMLLHDGRLVRVKDVTFYSGFLDPLGITQLIEEERYPESVVRLIEACGGVKLDIASYVERRLLPKLESAPERLVGDRDRLAQMRRVLARYIMECKPDADVVAKLGAVAMVPVRDGRHCAATETYVYGSAASDLLGDWPTQALDPGDDAAEWRSVLVAIGARERPLTTDIISLVESATRERPAQGSITTVLRVLRYLQACIDGDEAGTAVVLAALSAMKWLPTSGDMRWCAPNDLYFTFQRYLFESQAAFIAFDQRVQTELNKALTALGVPQTPELGLVIAHLIHCARNGTAPNREVYTHLQRAATPDDLRPLRNENCLFLSARHATSPSRSFWNHPFGEYRTRLGDEWEPFRTLCSDLGVKESPHGDDAVGVLLDLSSRFGSQNLELPESECGVVAECWRLITTDIRAGCEPAELHRLGSEKVVANRDGVLKFPSHVLFRDNPILAELFEAELGDILIDRDESTWTGMSKAGVRGIAARIVKRHTFERPAAAAKSLIIPRLRDRWDAISRIIMQDEANGADERARYRSLLEPAYERAVTGLSVTYEISGLRVRPQTIQTPSYWDGEGWHVDHGRTIEWDLIAADIVYDLDSSVHARDRASAVCQVLEAQSALDAARKLDRLGYAKVTSADVVGPEAAKAGIGAAEWDVQDVLQEVQDDETPGAADAVAQVVDDARRAPTSSASWNGGSGRSAGPLGARPRYDPPTQRVNRSVLTRRSVRRRAGRGRLISYVESGLPRSTSSSARYLAIGAAAVERVVRFELDAGREVERLPHDHPGYDLVSRAGSDTRYIEVKGCAGAWDDRGVALSRVQLRTAIKRCAEYWMYVVESAEDNERFRIRRIHDPFSRATEFRFDRGWRSAALPDDTRPAPLEPAAGRYVLRPGETPLRIVDVSRGNALVLLTVDDGLGAVRSIAFRPSMQIVESL